MDDSDLPAEIKLLKPYKLFGPSTILLKASEVFKDPNLAEAWLASPAYGLGGQRPVDVMKTTEGTQRIHDYLDAIGAGNYW